VCGWCVLCNGPCIIQTRSGTECCGTEGYIQQQKQRSSTTTTARRRYPKHPRAIAWASIKGSFGRLFRRPILIR
jgi:hypothetical protein